MAEMPSCYTKTTPKANKDHTCVECGGVIRRGEVYHRITGIWEGAGATFKMCSDCADLRQEVIDMICDPDEFPAFGELGYHCGEFGGDLEKRFEANRKCRAQAQARKGE